MSQEPTGKTNTLQTLDRGLQALDVICQLAQGITVAELAAALQVNRAIAYRLVNTLELHGLVARAAGGRIVAGAGVARLGAGFAAQFRARAQPVRGAHDDHRPAGHAGGPQRCATGRRRPRSRLGPARPAGP